MTDLTGQAGVPVPPVVARNIVVTHRARFPPRVLHLLRGDRVDCGGPVMSNFPECFGNQKVAREDQGGDQ
jgi:hypothetical protein